MTGAHSVRVRNQSDSFLNGPLREADQAGKGFYLTCSLLVA